MATHDKALIISKSWAAVITGVAVAGIIGASGTAVTAYAQIAVMQEDLRELKDAKFEPRVVAIEQAVKRVEIQQERMDNKLDQLLQRTLSNRRNNNE